MVEAAADVRLVVDTNQTDLASTWSCRPSGQEVKLIYLICLEIDNSRNLCRCFG